MYPRLDRVLKDKKNIKLLKTTIEKICLYENVLDITNEQYEQAIQSNIIYAIEQNLIGDRYLRNAESLGTINKFICSRALKELNDLILQKQQLASSLNLTKQLNLTKNKNEFALKQNKRLNQNINMEEEFLNSQKPIEIKAQTPKSFFQQ